MEEIVGVCWRQTHSCCVRPLCRKGATLKGQIYVQIFDTSHSAICSLQTTAFPNKDEEDAPAWASSELLGHLGLWGLDFALNCLILVG